MKKLLLSILLLSMSIASFAQLITPFTIRYQVTQKGGITIIGNTATSCGAAVSSCQNHSCATAHLETAPNGVGVDNDFVQSYVDIDNDATTFMSSSDSLTLPSCSLISFAGLYWGAGGAIGEANGPNWATRANAKIKVNNGAYQSITADATFDNNTGYKSYHNFKNITNIVTAAGINARFTLANMPLLDDNGNTTNRWGGWAIVVVYRNDLQSLKNLIVFNGLTNVSSTNTTTDIPISGFLTPPTGPVNFQLGLITYDGDRGASLSACTTSYVGDSLLFKSAGGFVPISDAKNPINDVMNSTLTINGAATLYRNPLYGNTLGYDADIFVPNNTAKNYIANSATTATIRERTGGETYITQVVTSAIDVFEPDLRGGLTVVDLNGGSVVPGDTLEYTATIKNIGSNPSINTYVVDTILFNCVYVPGSMRIVYGPNTGAKTDVAGDDQGEFYSAAKSIKIRIGTGANAVSGGQLLDSPTGIDSTQVKFRVTVTTDCISLLCNNVISNRFHVVGTGFISGNTFDNGSNPTIFDSHGCPVQGSTNTPITSITCNPPVASNNSPTCVGGNITLSVESSSNATYSWTGPNGFASTLQNPVITNVTSAMAGPYTVVISVTGTNCTFTATSTSVVVNPAPTVTSASSATICSGGTVNIPLTENLPGTFTWIATDNPNTTGESLTTQSTSTLNNTIVNNTAVPQTVTYTVTPIANLGSCPGTPQTVTVTVNPAPTMTSAASATICWGGTVSIPLTANVASSFTWIAADNPNTTGESLTTQNTATLSNTITNNSLVPQVVTYTVTPTATLGSCVSTTPQTVLVTVNPAPTMTSSATATICSGTLVSIPLTSSVPSTYTWIATNNPNTTGESLTLQHTSTLANTITDNSLVTQVVTYTVTPTATTGGCVGATQIVNVTVNPTPVMTSATTATICSGGTVSIPLTATVGSTFSWIATDNPNTTGESLTTQNTSTLINTIVNTFTVPQTVTYTVTATATVGGCSGATQTVTVTVNPTPVMTSTNSATICSGGAVTISLTATTGSTFTWIAANNPNVTGASTTLQNTSTINNTLVNTSLVPQTVIYTVTPTATTGGCVGATQTVSVTVNPTPVMTSTNTAAICSGGTVNIPLTATVSSVFTWIATDNPNTTGESTTLQNTSTINDVLINTSLVPQTVTYTVTPTATAGGCAGATQTVTITVNPTPIMTSTNSAIICSGGTVNIPLTSTVGSTFTWIATDNPNTTGESTTLQNTSTLNNTIINTSLVPQTVTYTVTPTATVGGCAGATQTVTVTVNPTPVMTSTNSATICSGDTLNIALTATVPSTFTWIATNNPNTTGESTTLQNTSTINNTIINNSTVVQTVVYTVTPTATTGGCVAASPQTVNVTVNPAPVMTSPNSATICSGSTVSIPLTSTVPSSYTWIAADNPNTSGESTTLQTTNTISNTIFNPGTTPQTVVYTVTPTALLGGCVTLSPQTVNVIVNPMDSAAFSYSSQTYCQTGANPTPVITGLPGGTFTSSPAGLTINSSTGLVTLLSSALGTYTITYSTNGICPNTFSVQLTVTIAPSAAFSYQPNVYCQGSSPNPIPVYGPGASGETFTASPAGLVFVSSSTGEVDLQLSTPGTYAVTNTIVAAGGCAQAVSTTTITINPAATVSSGGNGVMCSSGTYQLAGTFGGGASSIIWSTSGTGSFNNPSLPNAVYTPSPADIAVGTATLTITTNDPMGPCGIVSDSLLLTINPAVVVDAGGNATICSGTTYTLSGSIGGGATSSTWSTSGTGSFDNTTITNATYTPSAADIAAGSVTLTLTSNDPVGPCPALSSSMVLTINPAATANAGADATICALNNYTVSGTIGGGATSGTWTTTGTGTFANPNSLSTTYNPSNADDASGSVILILTTNDPAGICGAIADSLTLHITPRDNANFSYSSGTYCHTGINPTPTITGFPGGTFTSSPAGLSINGSTGTITLLSSALGTYSVYYTTNGPCPWIDTVLVTITTAPSANFSYNPNVYCQHSNPNAVPTFPVGSSAGVFSALPSGLVFVNTTTGVVDLNLSAPGTYTVTNYIAAAGGCAADTASNTITINPNATVDAGADATICSTSSYTLSGTIGGGATSSTWTSSGTGSFDNTALLNAIYTPSLADISAGTVTLTLTTNDPAGPCPSVSDNMVLTINPAATANAGADATMCATSSYTLSGSIGGSATSLSWSSLGSGTFNNTTIPNATYTPSPADDAAGTVTLILTTNDPAGVCNAATDTIILTITPRDNPAFSYPGSTYCQSGVNPVPTITGLAGGTFTSTPVGLIINPATGVITLLSSAVGTYTVMYHTSGTCPDSATAPITITPLFIASFHYSGPYCQHSSPDATITFSPNGSAGTFTSHPAGLIINSGNGTIDLQNSFPGTYTVVNSIAASGGCAATSDSATVVINPLDNATFSYPSSPYCNNGATPTPLVTGLAGGTFTGSVAGLNSATGAIALPAVPGSYTIVYTTNGTCPNTDSTRVTILAAPLANAGTNPQLVCGGTVQLVGTGSSSGNNYTYLWTTLTGNILTGVNNPLATANQPGVYTLTVTDTATGCVSTDTMTVFGTPAPVASFTTNPNPATGTVPLTVTFTNTSTNATTYLWNFGDGTATSNAPNPTHVFSHTGVYTVVLYVSANGNCLDSASVIVVVYDQFAVVFPNIFTPNDDGINDVFKINTTGASGLDCVIFDRWGLKIFEWHTIDGGWDGHNANGVKVSDGTYFFIADITDGDGKVTQTTGAFTLMR